MSHKAFNKKDYFEGWYFKFVTADHKQTIAFIPGISIEGDNSHAFVQVNISPGARTYYFKYALSAFHKTENPFSVTIGETIFSMESCKIDLNDLLQASPQGISFTGTIYMSEITPIKASLLMPNIMGFFAYVPNMECNHGVLSMNHKLSGTICQSDQQVLDFSGGKGYIEKDWGTSFPSDYIWIQANHFESEADSFMCSIANIPFGLLEFRGLIANLHVDGVEYRFATYNQTQIKNLIIEPQRVSFDLVKRGTILNCIATLKEVGALKAPQKGVMQRTIKEGLNGAVMLTLNQKGRQPLVLKSSCAGIEIVGALLSK